LTECAKLRKTPKVYNALITTDENLSPSKAYPIIQPVIQPAIPVLSPIYPVYSQYSSSNQKVWIILLNTVALNFIDFFVE